MLFLFCYLKQIQFSQIFIVKVHIFLISLNLLTQIISGNTLLKDNCELPLEWRGKWAQADFVDSASPILIQSNGISGKNDREYKCIENPSPNLYIFEYYHESDNDKCLRCLYFTERHRNILQYRESDECHDSSSIETCVKVPPSNPLLSLYRLKGSTEPCPIVGGPFGFGYSKDGRKCEYFESKSKIELCSDPSLLKFNYEACANVKGSEKMREIVRCLGSWREGHVNYFVAHINHPISKTVNETYYRCYNYAPKINYINEKLEGYHLSRSDIGACTHEPLEGFLTYDLNSIKEEEELCTFPDWFTNTQNSNWSILNQTIFMNIPQLSSLNGTILISNSEGKTLQKIICLAHESSTQNSASFQALSLFGCQRIPICVDFYQRTPNILEIELHSQSNFEGAKTCSDLKMLPSHHLTYTILNMDSLPNSASCGLVGNYSHLTFIPNNFHEEEENHANFFSNNFDKQEDSWHHLHEENGKKLAFFNSGCSEEEENSINFYQENNELMSSFTCVGRWVEGENNFAIGKNEALGVKGFRCFQFHKNLNNKILNGQILINDCKSSFQTPNVQFSFIATLINSCSKMTDLELMNSLSSQGSNFQNIPLFTMVLLLAFL